MQMLASSSCWWENKDRKLDEEGHGLWISAGESAQGECWDQACQTQSKSTGKENMRSRKQTLPRLVFMDHPVAGPFCWWSRACSVCIPGHWSPCCLSNDFPPPMGLTAQNIPLSLSPSLTYHFFCYLISPEVVSHATYYLLGNDGCWR